ncbi:serine/threonine protein kinase [Streptomyces sp. NPDC054887]
MGEVFAGRYELVDPIGRGGVGAVWRAWDHRRRRYVAAKVLQQSDAHTLLRFVREQAVRIDHPHVLAPASWAADDDKVLFTMDLVGGGSLAHLIGDYGPLPPRFVCTLLDQLLAGLTAVHAEGVVHRDIKPANVLLEATGTGRPHLRLSDFGISMRKGEPRLTETDYVVGTPGYFAPEQLMGAEPDFPADLFAVGLVALYLVQGQKPDAQALVEHFARYGTPGAPQGIPEPLWQVVAGLLQPDPQARFRTATGARKALTAAVEMLPEPGPADEPVEVFDQIGPLPPGFGPDGPTTTAPGLLRHLPGHPLPPQPPGQPRHGTQGTPPHGTGPQLQPGAPAHPPRVGPHSRSGPHPDSVQQPSPPPEPPHAYAHPSQQAQPSEPSYPSQQSRTSDPASLDEQSSRFPPARTGDFHLAPPPRRPPPPEQPPTPPTYAHPPAQAPASSPGAQRYPFQGPWAATDHEQALTRPYTAQVPEVPDPQAPTVPGGPHAPVQTRRKRPGPPPKVTIPVLLLALVCFAVGFWALTQT